MESKGDERKTKAGQLGLAGSHAHHAAAATAARRDDALHRSARDRGEHGLALGQRVVGRFAG